MQKQIKNNCGIDGFCYTIIYHTILLPMITTEHTDVHLYTNTSATVTANVFAILRNTYALTLL